MGIVNPGSESTQAGLNVLGTAEVLPPEEAIHTLRMTSGSLVVYIHKTSTATRGSL